MHPPEDNVFVWYLKRLQGCREQAPGPVLPSLLALKDAIISLVLACGCLLLLAVIHTYAAPANYGVSPLIPAFGASAMIVFGSPEVPAAQPRVILFAHLSAAILSIAIANSLASVEQPWGARVAACLGCGVSILVMKCANMVHAPAAATAMICALAPFSKFYGGDRGFFFSVGTVLLGCAVVIVTACIFNNMVPNKPAYPRFW